MQVTNKLFFNQIKNNTIQSMPNQFSVQNIQNDTFIKNTQPEQKSGNDDITFGSGLTLQQKKEIKHKARNNATGWAIFGGIISTAYYGLRSDKTIAKKYNLDPISDRNFIKEIKKDQTLWTIPSLLPINPLALVAWIYSKCQDSEDMTIKSERI